MLRRRIEVAEELRSVTGTMKSLAAVSVHQYERSVLAVHEYLRGIELGLQIVLRADPRLARPRPPAHDGRELLVVFGSARGLCGPLNRVVAHEADGVFDGRGTGSTTVIASGARMAGELEAVGLDAAAVLDVPASADGIGPLVEDLLVLIDEWRAAGPSGRVVLVHPRPRAGGRQYDPAVVDLLPHDATRLGALADAPWPTRQLPATRGDPRAVFAGLGRQLLFVELHRAFAETQVCIHRARLAAMQAAEDSIGQRLDELEVRFARQRQATITSELADVLAGYEAAGGGTLVGGPPPGRVRSPRR